jgi:hypothetical protein
VQPDRPWAVARIDVQIRIRIVPRFKFVGTAVVLNLALNIFGSFFGLGGTEMEAAIRGQIVVTNCAVLVATENLHRHPGGSGYVSLSAGSIVRSSSAKVHTVLRVG